MSRAISTGLLGAAFSAAAVVFGLPSLHVPGVGLAMLALGAALWVTLAARHASVELSAERGSVEEDRPLYLRATTRLAGFGPAAELVVPPLGAPVRVGAGSAEHLVEARPGRRGRRTVGPARLSVTDPLGLAERVLEAPAVEVLVLPRVEPVEARGAGGSSRGASARRRGTAGPELELDRLSAYRPGTPAARIHWPTVARSGALVERRLVADEDSDPLVVLDLGVDAGGGELDDAVRAAASLCSALARRGGCRLLLPGERRPARIGSDMRAWPAAHARLALAAPVEGPARSASVAGTAPLFWVSTSAEVPRALLRSRAPDRWLLTPGSDPLAADLRVGGCSGRRLGARARRAA